VKKCVISFIEVKNNSGLKTDRCGTELVISLNPELSPLIQTLCFLTLSHTSIKSLTLPVML